VEARFKVQTAEPYVSVQAKNRAGKVLATSKTVEPAG
jgi:hypothetical protein